MRCMPMTLIDVYNGAVKRGEINDDLLQRDVVADLQRLADDLAILVPGWFFWRRKKPVTGLYLHGPVGVGKTYLMDLFYENVTEPRKARFHFHHFMQQVDAQLRRIQGQKNPIKRIAADLAKSTRLLCLDEFLVHDVADAMILAELLKALFAHDIVLVATANTQPDDLYASGVHRERFLPAIALIKQHCDVILLSEDRDYRLGRTPVLQAWLSPLDSAAHRAMVEQFTTMVINPRDNTELTVQNRSIFCVKSSEQAVWFTFNVICNVPRCQLDYLEIAERFDTVFVSDIPVLSADDTVRAIMLIHFIDVMYDRGIHLIVSAASVASKLYVSGPMFKSFQRTVSRLEEMQSVDYLRRHKHRNLSNFSLT